MIFLAKASFLRPSFVTHVNFCWSISSLLGGVSVIQDAIGGGPQLSRVTLLPWIVSLDLREINLENMPHRRCKVGGLSAWNVKYVPTPRTPINSVHRKINFVIYESYQLRCGGFRHGNTVNLSLFCSMYRLWQ